MNKLYIKDINKSFTKLAKKLNLEKSANPEKF